MLQDGYPLQSFVGTTERMQNLRQTIAQVAKTNVTVFISGEPGTGKTLAARTIHELSSRRKAPFLSINCAAISTECFEAELFGFQKSAFIIGARNIQKGHFELANGGTIFLRELADMPLAIQAKLFRLLEEGAIERVGGKESIPLDVRVFGASHSNLELAVKRGEFREDLYYRLTAFPLELPPMRDYLADLKCLITALIERFSSDYHTSLQFTEAAIAVLSEYSWPGNAYELGNLVERMMIFFPNKTVDVAQLPLRYRKNISNVKTNARLSVQHSLLNEHPEHNLISDYNIPKLTYKGTDLKKIVMETEIDFIKQALKMADGVVARAADLLNLRRTTLVEKMRKYNINRQEMASV